MQIRARAPPVSPAAPPSGARAQAFSVPPRGRRLPGRAPLHRKWGSTIGIAPKSVDFYNVLSPPGAGARAWLLPEHAQRPPAPQPPHVPNGHRPPSPNDRQSPTRATRPPHAATLRPGDSAPSVRARLARRTRALLCAPGPARSCRLRPTDAAARPRGPERLVTKAGPVMDSGKDQHRLSRREAASENRLGAGSRRDPQPFQHPAAVHLARALGAVQPTPVDGRSGV